MTVEQWMNSLQQAIRLQDSVATLSPPQTIAMYMVAILGGENVSGRDVVEKCLEWQAEYGEPTQENFERWVADVRRDPSQKARFLEVGERIMSRFDDQGLGSGGFSPESLN